MDKQYESIKNKIKKLMTLAGRGVQGEAENARRLLEKLCKEYDISPEELLDENQKKWHIFDIGRNKIYKVLFSQCYFSIIKGNTMPYKSVSQSKIAVELTAMQYAELIGLYEWHKANFKRDFEEMKKNVFTAYCRKHKLYHIEDNQADIKISDLTPKELERLWKIVHLQEYLNDTHYHKLID